MCNSMSPKDDAILSLRRVARWLLKKILNTEHVTDDDIEDLFRRMQVNLDTMNTQQIVELRRYLFHMLDCAKKAMWAYEEEQKVFNAFLDLYYHSERGEIEERLREEAQAILERAKEQLKQGRIKCES